jgi:hypothetical protein
MPKHQNEQQEKHRMEDASARAIHPDFDNLETWDGSGI